jgi:hypothetical protein
MEMVMGNGNEYELDVGEKGKWKMRTAEIWQKTWQ